MVQEVERFLGFFDIHPKPHEPILAAIIRAFETRPNLSFVPFQGRVDELSRDRFVRVFYAFSF